MQARTKGPKAGSDGMKDATRGLNPSVTRAPENSGAFRERLNNLSLI